MRHVCELLLLLACCSWLSSSLPKVVSDCEKKAHSSLSSKQRQELCDSWAGDYSVGPAMCSAPAKDKLRLSAENIIKLCKEASSDAPAECMLKLDNSQRNSVGMKLCQKVGTPISAECFKWLSSTSKGNNALKADDIVNFCRSIEDRAPINCLQAISNYTNLPAAKSLGLCKEAVGSGDSSQHHPLNHVVSHCIQEMSPYIKPSLGVHVEDIISFCVSINHHQHQHLASEEAFTTSAVDCFKTLSNVTTPSKDYHGPTLSIKHKMDICRNAPITLGPVNCTMQTLQKVASRDPNIKLKGEDLAHLCVSAISSGPSDCFVESKGLGNTEERLTLCNTAINAVSFAMYFHS